MLQQLIKSISRALAFNVSQTTNHMKQSITEVTAKTDALRAHVDNQIWTDILDKERRIVSNTLQLVALEGNLKKAIGEVNQRVDDRVGSLTGMIDDTNLDSIREIADRIKADAAETQGLRSEMQQADQTLHARIDSLISAELQSKSDQELDQYINRIVAQEFAVVGN